jgi:hypothetical protein
MPVWARRGFLDTTYLSIVDRMAEQELALGSTSEHMMVRTRRDDDRKGITTVFIRVPDPALLAAYEGFERVNDVDLPQEVILLYGDLSEFRKLFRSSLI